MSALPQNSEYFIVLEKTPQHYWKVVTIAKMIDVQKIPSYGTDPNIQAINLDDIQKNYASPPYPLTGSQDQIQAWQQEFEMTFNRIKSYEEENLFLIFYRSPGQERWIFTTLFYKSPVEEIKFKDPLNSAFISVYEARRYYNVSYPNFASKDQLIVWLSNFENVYNSLPSSN